MTDNNHPITPPPELIQQWWDGTHGALYEFEAVAAQAARWGADQELMACINYFHEYDPSWGEDSELITGLRAARRPKPPSLKELAQAELDRLIALIPSNGALAMAEPIRRALESLPE